MSMRYKRNWKNLVTVIKLMTRPQGATNKQIAEEIKCSKETVYRLKRDLEKDIPIFEDGRDSENRIVFKLEPGFLQKVEGVALPNVHLAEEDLITLCLLRAGGGILRGASFEKRLALSFFKIGQSLSGQDNIHLGHMNRMFHVSGALGSDYAGNENILFELMTAIMHQRTCRVTYHSFYDDKVKTFRIDPLCLVQNNGGLYCRVRISRFGERKTLAVQRIRSLKVFEESFKPPEDFDPEKEFYSAFGIVNNEPLSVRLWISQNQARYILERVLPPDTTVVEQEDGSVVLEMRTSGRFEVRRWILSMGGDALVLEPPEFKQEVETELRRALNGYETD